MTTLHDPKPRTAADSGSAPTVRSVRLMIDRIVADATTNEVGKKDEVVLTTVEPVVEVVAAGDKPKARACSRRGATITAGQFKKGDVRDFNPARPAATIPIGSRQGDWPRTLHSTVLLIETDENEIGKIVAAVIDAIDKDVTKALAGAAAGLATTVAAAALAGSAAGSVVPVIGTAVGAAVAAAGAAAFKAITQARKDDLFPPQVASVRLPAYPQHAGKVQGSEFTLRFQAKGGSYRVSGWWEAA